MDAIFMIYLIDNSRPSSGNKCCSVSSVTAKQLVGTQTVQLTVLYQIYTLNFPYYCSPKRELDSYMDTYLHWEKSGHSLRPSMQSIVQGLNSMLWRKYRYSPPTNRCV